MQLTCRHSYVLIPGKLLLLQFSFVVSNRIVQLIAGNTMMDCRDTASRMIRVPGNCRIAVPTAFTPNNDGINDYLYPLNAYRAKDLDFKVFNRYGQLLFTTKDWTRKWNGSVNGIPRPVEVYAWTLTYIHIDTGKRVSMKGTALLLR